MWVVLVLVPLLLVGGWVAWVAYTFVNGTAGSSAQVAALQAEADEAFSDYPVRVTRLRHQSFIGKTWFEFRLVAVEDRSLKVDVSVYGGSPHWEDARRSLKIKRDGEVGTPPRLLNPTPPPDFKESYWNVSGSGPEADFSDQRPYDWDQSHMSLAVYSADDDLSARDAEVVQAGLAVVGDRRDRLGPIRIYHSVQVTGIPSYFYEVSVEAAGGASLAQDFERVRAGGSAPGVRRVAR